MKFNNKLLLVAGLALLFLMYNKMEGFVNFTKLSGFNNSWGDNAGVKNIKPIKTSNLVAGCDSKRETCITY